jgi:hypothetical protein
VVVADRERQLADVLLVVVAARIVTGTLVTSRYGRYGKKYEEARSMQKVELKSRQTITKPK